MIDLVRCVVQYCSVSTNPSKVQSHTPKTPSARPITTWSTRGVYFLETCLSPCQKILDVKSSGPAVGAKLIVSRPSWYTHNTLITPVLYAHLVGFRCQSSLLLSARSFQNGENLSWLGLACHVVFLRVMLSDPTAIYGGWGLTMERDTEKGVFYRN